MRGCVLGMGGAGWVAAAADRKHPSEAAKGQ